MNVTYEIFKVDMQLRRLFQELDQNIDTETGEINEGYETIFEQIQMLVTDKKSLQNDLLNEIRNLESLIKSHREEEKKIADRRHCLENRVLRYKEIALSIAENNDGKLDTNNWNGRIRTTPKVMSFDLDIMPKEIDGVKLIRIKVEPDKKAIIKLHKQGVPVLGAVVGESKSIVIKYK